MCLQDTRASKKKKRKKEKHFHRVKECVEEKKNIKLI